MSFIKASLAAAKEALLKHDYSMALECSDDILEEEPTNYTALLFRGKALDHMGKAQDSARAYRRAIEERPGNQLGWKGLLALYEGNSDWKNYLDAFVGYVQCCQAENDLTEAHKALTKLQTLFRSKKVDSNEQKQLLKLQLPGSPIYEFLQGFVVDLDTVLLRLTQLIESEEKKLFKTNKTQVDVSQTEENKRKYNVMSKSELPGLYQDMLDFSHNDANRRMAEQMQFAYYVDLLFLSPPEDDYKKKEYLAKVLDLISGIMIVKAPIAQAWTLGMNWKDVKTLGDLDFEELKFYVNHFDYEGTAKVLTGFLHSKLSPFPILISTQQKKDDTINEESETSGKVPVGKQKRKKRAAEDFELWSDNRTLEFLAEGLDLNSNDILSFRIAGEYYLKTREYETAADIALKAISATENLKRNCMLELPNAMSHFQLILAVSYVYYDAPKNHSIAAELFEKVLLSDPENIDAQVGRGLIYREQGKLSKAHDLLRSAVERFPENYQVVYEYSLCLLKEGYDEEARAGLDKCLENVSRTDLASTDFRSTIMWQISNSYWLRRSSDPSGIQKSFDYLVRILQENPNYGPAYTSLGNYYNEIANDSLRATKCYYKAFELDSGEIEAAEKLAEDFASRSEWDMVEVVADRVVNSDKIRLGVKSEKVNWPYRALGIVSINHKNYGQAVGYFQKALRLSSKDASSWMGLGESYVNSGRYTAGAKAFERALKLEPELWFAQLQLALVERELFHFKKSIDLLKCIFSHDEMKIGCILIEVLIQSAFHNFMQDFYGDAVADANMAVDYSWHIVGKLKKSDHHLWKCLASATELFLQIQSLISSAPIERLTELIETGARIEDCLEDLPLGDDSKTVNSKLMKIMISSGYLSEVSAGTRKLDRALGAYNLGLCYLKALKYTAVQDKTKILDECITNLKKAIQLEPRNEKYWNAYGLASAHINSRVSQHCFIRSLRFNENQVEVWCNLGALYLSNGDRELASAAFERVQGLDPENAFSWLGKAMISFTSGEREQSSSYFEQSSSLSKGNNSVSKLLYGLSTYEDDVLKSSFKNYHRNLENGILGLEKMLKLAPDNELGLAVQGSLMERQGNYEHAIAYLSKLSEIIEERYEQSALDEDVPKFAFSKAQLARLYLGCSNYEKSLSEAELAMNLSDGSENFKRSTLSGVLTAGLACFFLDRFDDSIDYFKQALDFSNDNVDVIVLLVQVLWAHGGETERRVAIEQLYGAVDTGSVKITVLLGVIGLLGNYELQQAAEEELDLLPFSELENDLDNSIPAVLSMLKGNKDPWQKSAVYWPTNYNIMRNVDKNLALAVAKRSNKITSMQMSNAYAEVNKGIDLCQTAVFLAPWNIDAWKSLGTTLETS